MWLGCGLAVTVHAHADRRALLAAAFKDALKAPLRAPADVPTMRSGEMPRS